MKLSTALQYSTDYALPYLLGWVPKFGRSASAGAEPMECNGLRVSCYRQWPAESPVLAEWDALFARCPSATAFASQAWQMPVLRRVGRIGTLRLVTVSFENRLLAVLPLQKRKGDTWESVGMMLSDYLDPLIDPAVPGEQVWGAILAFCRSQADCSGIVLHHIPDASESRAALPAVCAAEGYSFEDAVTCQVSGIDLPNTWDKYLVSLGGHDRKEVRRKMKKAEAEASAVLDSNNMETPTPQLEQTFQFMEAAGGSAGRKARWMFRGQFRSAAAPLHEKGLLQVGMLRLNGAPAAGLICLRGPAGPMTWGTGYAEQYKQFSPGIVTFAMTIRRAIECGSRRIDFLRGQYPYKYNLGATDVPLHGLTLRPRTA
jgi:CelD/BcsL family acetyltransferase involved in cellulose biosynthesis